MGHERRTNGRRARRPRPRRRTLPGNHRTALLWRLELRGVKHHIEFESEDCQFAPEQVPGSFGGDDKRCRAAECAGNPGRFPVQLRERMEPERNIEKLLRAFAQKRRDAAGDPLKLHPATRRLLQDEVARRAPTPEPEPEEPSVSLWQFFRQQWAVLCGFALMIFLGATLLFPALSASKKRAQSISAMNNLQQIGIAAHMVAGENNGKLPATLDELTNGLVSKQTLTDPVSGKPFVYLAASRNLDDLQSNDVLAYSSAEKDRRAVLLANGRVEFADRERFSDLTNRKSVAFVLADHKAGAQPASTVANEPAPATQPTPPL